jgi:uncharacterized protein (TIGR04141 family)
VPDTPKPQPLTVYLAKDAHSEPRSVIDDFGSVKQISFEHTLGPGAALFIPSTNAKLPKWTSFFADHVPSDTFAKTRSEGALLVLRHNDRVFAVAFGTGRFQLKQDCWEERFGLRVALNCVGNNVVKSIDKHTLDPLARHTREQASREATASEFGLDIEQDLLRAVTGTPTDPSFGKWVSGTDSLHLSVSVDLHGLPDLLGRLHQQFLDDSYKTTFPWVGQIAEVKDSSIVESLNGLLAERLRSGNRDNTWMAVPEVISWDSVGGFRYPGSGGPRIEYHDIHLDGFLDSIGGHAELESEMLHSRVVECVDPDGGAVKRWKVRKCLYCELDYQEDSYLLNSGSWYRVRRDFVQTINEAVARIPDYEIALPVYDDATEGEYIRRVAAADASLAVMDQRNILHGGGSSKIEFCDLLTAAKDVIHIKRYGQSAALSHLFAQGLTSGELFQTDPDFRRKLNDELPLAHRLADPAIRPAQGEYRIVFAIVSDRPGALRLPFFSRLNLRHAARRLDGYGFRIAKAKILVHDRRARLQRVRSRRRAA